MSKDYKLKISVDVAFTKGNNTMRLYVGEAIWSSMPWFALRGSAWGSIGPLTP